MENVGIFHGHLEYLWSFGIFYSHLPSCGNIVPRYGILCQEQSGNPDQLCLHDGILQIGK
jgi:hypothetical protein